MSAVRKVTLCYGPPTKTSPPVLLTDELSAGDDQAHKMCINFGQVAVRGWPTSCFRCFFS